jgi:hypothetical protein
MGSRPFILLTLFVIITFCLGYFQTHILLRWCLSPSYAGFDLFKILLCYLRFCMKVGFLLHREKHLGFSSKLGTVPLPTISPGLGQAVVNEPRTLQWLRKEQRPKVGMY